MLYKHRKRIHALMLYYCGADKKLRWRVVDLVEDFLRWVIGKYEPGF